MSVLNYVISLKDADKRRQHITEQFVAHKVAFSFFDALRPTEAKQYANEKKLAIDSYHLTDGEIACFMSHVALWHKIVDENIPYMAIYEDDIHLGVDSQEYLNHSNWIDTSWDIIKLEAFAPATFLSHKSFTLPYGNRKMYQLLGQNYGTAGYILSLKGAQLLLKFIDENTVNLPLDHLMFEHYLAISGNRVFQMTPALCIQDMILNPQQQNQNLASALIQERHYRMKATKKKGIQKLFLELNRIWKQFIRLIFAKKIFFK